MLPHLWSGSPLPLLEYSDTSERIHTNVSSCGSISLCMKPIDGGCICDRVVNNVIVSCEMCKSDSLTSGPHSANICLTWNEKKILFLLYYWMLAICPGYPTQPSIVNNTFNSTKTNPSFFIDNLETKSFKPISCLQVLSLILFKITFKL